MNAIRNHPHERFNQAVYECIDGKRETSVEDIATRLKGLGWPEDKANPVYVQQAVEYLASLPLVVINQ